MGLFFVFWYLLHANSRMLSRQENTPENYLPNGDFFVIMKSRHICLFIQTNCIEKTKLK